jgi:hypothetical protein
MAVHIESSRSRPRKELRMPEHLFDAELQYRADMEPIVPVREDLGELIGSGDGTLVGSGLAGSLRWTLHESPGELVCAMDPVAEIETKDGARVWLEACGYARRPRPHDRIWSVAATLRFKSADDRYLRLDDADGDGEWLPESAVVVAGVIDRQRESFRGCCPVMNFFASRKNAERWLEEHTEIRGDMIATREAIEVGRVVFGDVLRES